MIDYNFNSSESETGSHDWEDTKTIKYPFDRYEIFVKLTIDNKFLGIEGVKINKDFLSYRNKMSLGYHDVDEYYQD